MSIQRPKPRRTVARAQHSRPLRARPGRNLPRTKEHAGPAHTRRRELPADLDTPITAYLKLHEMETRFLLESAEPAGHLGRYSFLGIGTAREIVVRDGVARIRDETGERSENVTGDPLERVRGILGTAGDPDASALKGAAVGWVSFDYAARLERIPLAAASGEAFPELAFVVPRAVVTFDHLRRSLRIAAPQPLHDEIAGRLQGPLPSAARTPIVPGPAFRENLDPPSFAAGVRTAREHILAGDAFQIVLSRHLDARTALDPFALYRALRMRNPSPYAYFLDFAPWRIAGCSPEVLCRLEGRRATVRPIAGTRRRGVDAAEDAALERELLEDPKEAAEHVMLVDLGRNDLARVCDAGTVHVDAYRHVERFSHVMHLVSFVRGTLREGEDAFDLFRATFPAGTVSGAPKPRALELIAAIEGEARGPYAGAVGYLSPRGDADFAIAIRTAFFAGDRLRLQAGAGIVADSDPEREFEETAEKLQGLREAAAVAAGGLR